jgi:hypothetical protein
MRPGLAVLVLLASLVPTLSAQAPVGASNMIGGGDVTLRLSQEELHVTVTGPRAGLASLCIGDESRVRILHASAAVGEAVYERSGAQWVLTSKFEFKLRDTRTGGPTESDRAQYRSSMGWVANASRTGEGARNFAVHLTERIRFVGVTFLATDQPMAVSYWPASMDDGCREIKVAQGYLPDTAQFRPAGWHRVR